MRLLLRLSSEIILRMMTFLKTRRAAAVSVSAAVFLMLSIPAIPRLYRSMSVAGNGVASASAQMPVKEVAVYPVRRRDLARDLTLSAELRPYNVVNVYAKVSGYLRNITVDYGSIVQAGQVIGTLEVPEQEAEVQRTESAYRLAKLDYDRIRSVVQAEPGLIAQADVDKARTGYEVAKDQRDQAQTLLDYRIICAPFDGVVTKRNVDPGLSYSRGPHRARRPNQSFKSPTPIVCVWSSKHPNRSFPIFMSARRLT